MKGNVAGFPQTEMESNATEPLTYKYGFTGLPQKCGCVRYFQSSSIYKETGNNYLNARLALILLTQAISVYLIIS